MSTTNPCHFPCDFTDGDEAVTDDAGCCSPYPIRKSCEGPTIEVPDCDEQDPIIEFDEDTETFSVLTVMYDKYCSPWQDKNGTNWISKIG